MASIFNALNIGYTGLNAAQVGINTTSHNISNAESEGYTRQRVISAAAIPISSAPGNVGNGVAIMDIKRIFDNFVFDRYTAVSSDKEYSDFEMKTLEELSTYFPEIEGVGIKADLVEYYNMWQTLADNPDNDAIKLALATQTQTLTEHIGYTQDQITGLQSSLNEQLAVNINEINSLSQQVAELNKSIEIAESGEAYTANDLRDKRNVIERSLARLIGATTNSGQLESSIGIDSSSNTKTGSYTISINGFNIVDGNTYHPIHLSNKYNDNGFYSVSYERQDGVLIPIEDKITGGKVGSILNLRGGTLDTTSGMPTDGVIQNVITQFDAFAQGLIESTNNIYAKSATTKMESNVLDLDPARSMVNSPFNVKEGTFDLIVYDIDGNIAAKRAININHATTMTGVAGTNSIQAQIQAQVDDNEDGNANNNIDDFIVFNWATYSTGENALEFTINPLSESRGYTFSIEDNLEDKSYDSGTNFAGAFGISRYFDGDDAQSMKLNHNLQNNPTTINSGATPISGDSTIALNMVQHQYEKFNFYVGNQVFDVTTYAMFDIIATEVGSQTNAAILKNETVTTQFNATEFEYSSISKVSIDEEMANLIKYQTSYGAAAKIITTIDEMMETLLGIKR